MRLVVRDIAQLDTLLDGLAEYAQCNTSVVKSSPVKAVATAVSFPEAVLRTCPGYQTAPLVASLSEARAMRQQNRWLRVQQWWGRITRR